MSQSVSRSTRRSVISRAENQCEYCRFPADSAWLSFEIEHIISQKHGGGNELENLALVCPDCNRFKGTDIGSIDPETETLTSFFNPRTQIWSEHFSIGENGLVEPLSPEGRVTVKILRINSKDRLEERHRLIRVGGYPVLPI